MLIRSVEFIAYFAAFVAAVVFWFAPQIKARWPRFLKFAMYGLCAAFAVSEALLKVLTGQGWDDRAGHFVTDEFCFFFPDFPRCYEHVVGDLNAELGASQTTPALWIKRGKVQFKHSNFDDAIKDFSEAIRLDPASAVAFTGRAYVYRAKGDDARAIADIEQAGRIDSRFASAISDFASVAVRAFKQER